MATFNAAYFNPLSMPALLIGLVLLCVPAMIVAGDSKTLENVHRELADKFDEVSHLSADRLQRYLPDQVLILDVREQKEFAVSHLENAIQVDPDISHRQFMQRFEAGLKDKIVIFYCSVGYRSSELAEDLQSRLMASGTRAIYNLEEGIFGWHNDALPLVNSAGETSRIHPYDDHWGRLLKRQREISYEPAE